MSKEAKYLAACIAFWALLILSASYTSLWLSAASLVMAILVRIHIHFIGREIDPPPPGSSFWSRVWRR